MEGPGNPSRDGDGLRGYTVIARVAGIVVLAVVTALGVATPGATATPGDSPASWNCGSENLALGDVRVELAPVVSSERTPNGGPITPVASRGTWVPVILVHGWTSRSIHPNSDGSDDTQGAFSHLIDLTANKLAKAQVPRSLVGQLQGIPGAAVFTFDYHPYSGRWVTDAHLGPALGKVVDCLAAASHQKVILVGHSMGGLIARYAAANPDRSSAISTILTMGTPNTGSIAALLAAGALDAGSSANKALAVIRLVLAACGQVTSARMDDALCATLPDPVAAFDGEAGRALRAGSAELAALKPVPKAIYVDAVAGGTTFSVPRMGWFTLPWDTTDVPVGDMIVTDESATAGTKQSKVLDCSYQLSAVRGATDELGLRAGLTSANDVASAPWESFNGPCFHTSLMRSIELTNEVMGAINDDINPVLSDAQALNATIPAGVCGTWNQEEPIKLEKGIGVARAADGSFDGASIVGTSVLGRTDVDSDGQEELVLLLSCSGSEPAYCCAGRTSIMPSVAVFAVGRGGTLRQIGTTMSGGDSGPGDEYGPAARQIRDVRIQGSRIVTTEFLAYPEQYTSAQVGGDPFAPVRVTYSLRKGEWAPS